ncbi:hypothetical protein CYLTODRAFT_493506 [Cylindrobasidium torrendii FP15055 ss-10]|uniref:CoA-dependent acyltransferase n=1 Tax=Cylindrobasidium torrendii FP15055 ss-10 TaxID=1314674 RepID=A0A0D7B181_9AGAR|nr:hypothetical protein CYLTODRAFT_493506 [Cylindrobasidium torrendii FP15055 ss-10]
MHKDDRIVHLPILDQPYPARDIIVSSCNVARGRLRPDQLRAALDELVGRWPILTSRVEANRATHLLDLRIPASFSETRPSYVFTSKRSSGHCPHLFSHQQRIHPDILSIISDFRDTTTPAVIKDLLKGKDVPLLHIHVNVFDDATCIGIHIPHVLVDMLGLGIVAQAWAALVNSEDMKAVALPTLMEGDPLADWGSRSYPSDPAAQAEVKANTTVRLFGWWEKLRYYIPISWEVMTSKEEAHTIFIPFSVIERLRKETMAGDEKERWVSENDIVVAIIAHMHLCSIAPSQKPISIGFQANMRGCIPPLIVSGSVYLGNAQCAMRTELGPLVSAKEKTIPEIALAIRKSILAQRTPTYMAHTTTTQREMARRSSMPVYVPAHERAYNTTSWAGAGIGKLSFGGALESNQPDTADGSLAYAGGFAMVPTMPGRSIYCTVQGRVEKNEATGEEGGFWCDFGAVASEWRAIEAFLSQL